MEEENKTEVDTTVAIPLTDNDGNANTESSVETVNDQKDGLEQQQLRVEKSPKIRRFLEKFGSTSSVNFESVVHSPKPISPKEQSHMAKKSGNAGIANNVKVNSGHKRSNTVPDVVYRSNSESVDIVPNSKKFDTSRANIDTTAPFDSVRQAVTKFGGIVGKVQQSLTLEKQRGVQLEFRKVQEEVVKHRKQSEAAIAKKAETMKELESNKKLTEELKINLARAETQEAYAKQDLVLAELRVQEIKNGVSVEESTAIRRQLEVSQERHANAVAELSFIKKELETTSLEHESVIQELDTKMGKAEFSVAASKEMENTIEHLTMELITAKLLLEASHAAFINADENKIAAEMALEEEKHNFEKELKPVQTEFELLNEQIQLTNDLNSKVNASTTLLSNLKSELTSYVETKLNEEGENAEDEKITFVDEIELNPRQLLCRTRKELKDTRNQIEHSKAKVNCLGAEVASLSSELEKEQESLAAMKNKDKITSQSVSSLEAELDKENAELELIQTKEMEARERIEELPKQIELATQEAEQARTVANSAHEELKKAKEEIELAQARLNAVETRMNAAIMEIEAAKASADLATSTFNAREESEHVTPDSPKVVTLSAEEYYQLSKRAQEADELFNKRVISVEEQIKVVIESESLSLGKLEELNKMVQEKNERVKAVLEKAQKAEAEKLTMEQELQELISKHEMETKAVDEAQNFANNLRKVEPKNFASDDEDTASESSFTTSPDTVLPSNAKVRATVAPKKKISLFSCGGPFSKRKSVKH